MGAFAEALGNRGSVHVSSSDRLSSAKTSGDYFTVFPPINSDSYTAVVVEYCLDNEIRLIVPLIDADVAVLSRVRNELWEQGTLLLTPEAEIALILFDKLKTQSFLRANGFEQPLTVELLPDDILYLSRNGTKLPLVIKPRFGSRSRGVKVVKAYADFPSLFQEAKMDLAEISRELPSHWLEANSLIIQEYVDGSHYSVEIVNDLEGNFQGSMAREILKARNGETFVARTFQDSAIERMAEELSVVTKHPGPMDVDVIMKDTGEPIIVDLNPRFGGCYQFSHRAGANVPAAIIAEMLGKPIEDHWYEQQNGLTLAKTYDVVVLD